MPNSCSRVSLEISHAGQDPKPSLAYLADRYHKPCTSQVGEKWSYPFLPGRGSHKCLEWAGPFYWIWSIRGVVAVPLVRRGGGWGELKGKKNKKAPSAAPRDASWWTSIFYSLRHPTATRCDKSQFLAPNPKIFGSGSCSKLF